MRFIYNIAVYFAQVLLLFGSWFNKKLKLFLTGRKDTFQFLQEELQPGDRVLWLHAASLGEYEQGLPLVRELKKVYPGHKILMTFFSPSGYEVKKNTEEVDIVTYLPLDTIQNSRKFLELVQPQIAIFIKYEIWPNFIKELEKRGIPILLVSAIFNPKQLYFKWYGSLMRRALRRITHIFVQDENSRQLLKSVDIEQVTVNGDTRFDRVSEILSRNNTLPVMDQFVGEKTCFVAGSSWPEDEKILVEYINSSEQDIKYVIVPHDINERHLKTLKEALQPSAKCFTEIEPEEPCDFQVLIVDTIGLLTSIYSYADIAYVGGGFATGLHNTLEPAVFGIPVLIGPQYGGFKEVEELVAQKGILPVMNSVSFQKEMAQLLESSEIRQKIGHTNTSYISKNTGATQRILGFISTLQL